MAGQEDAECALRLRERGSKRATDREAVECHALDGLIVSNSGQDPRIANPHKGFQGELREIADDIVSVKDRNMGRIRLRQCVGRRVEAGVLPQTVRP